MNTQSNQETGSSLSKARVEAFSDGVFAVAITLLVLDLQAPPPNESLQKLLPYLFRLWPNILIYAMSFVIIGIYWVGHHNTFHCIKRADRPLLWFNILFLLIVVFIPFPTALLGRYPMEQVSIMIYGGTLMITGLTLELLWWYATNHCLVDKDIDPRLVLRATRRNLLAPCIYLLAMGTSFLSVGASLLFFVAVPVLYIFPGRVDHHWTGRHTGKLHEASIAGNEDASLSQAATSSPRRSNKL